MPLDPSIILQMKSPLDIQRGFADLQGQQIQNQAGMQNIQQNAQMQPYRVDAMKLEAMKKKNDMVSQALYGVTDEQSYQRARSWAQANGLDVSKLPDNYDPQVVQQLRMASMTVDERLRQMALEQAKYQPLTVTNTGPDGGLNQSIYSFDSKSGGLNKLMDSASISKGGAGGGASKTWQDAQNIMAAAQAKGIPIDPMTAYSIAKSGMGQGQTYGAQGMTAMPGALPAVTAMSEAKETGTQNAQVAAAAPKEEQKKYGEEVGSAAAKLSAMQAYMPRTQQVVDKLSKLAEAATYTMTGQAYNAAVRQLGLDVPDAGVARESYITTVRDELLPLLRQTFGAQFTAAEGVTLMTTLGDPNKSPAEKKAALNNFLEQKVGEIQSLQRQTGAAGMQVPGGTSGWKIEKVQ